MQRLVALLVCAVTGLSAAAAEGYDYYRNARYPGSLRKDVGLDKVEQAPDVDGRPGRRTVQWWPKRGVDIVDIPEGALLRTWTFRTVKDEPLLEMGFLAKWRDRTLEGKTQFKAHMVGFRGLGSEIGSPFGARPHASKTPPKDPWIPSVVLRLEDGRKRCFDGNCFSDEDQAYLLKLYVKEMERVHASLVDILYRTHGVGDDKPRPELLKRGTHATIGELYVPGRFRVDSRHFTIKAGSQSPVGGFSPWVSAANKKGTTQYRAATIGVFEDFWALLEYAGMYMHGWGGHVAPPRYWVEVPGTMVDGFGEIGGYAGGGGGGCSIRNAGWGLLFHEWGHGPGGVRAGWGGGLGGGETCSDSYPPVADPVGGAWKVSHQVHRPYKNLYHGGYPGCLIPTTLGEDPNWGYAFIGTVGKLTCEADRTPMHTIARLGLKRGLWKKGDAIRGMGDAIAQVACRLAEFDYEMQARFRKNFTSPLRQFLYCLDREEGLYRCNMAEAPEPFGCNHVLLKALPGAKEIAVDFRGHHDPATYGDWRACIVGVDGMGRCRYSPLWNKGTMSLKIKEGDQRYWLAVTATPTALPTEASARSVLQIYERDYACRYPYDVKLTGCRPGGPNPGIGTNANWDLVGPDYYTTKVVGGGSRGKYYDWPHPSDTPEYARMKERLERLLERYPAFEKTLLDPEVTRTYGWLHNRMLTGGLLQGTRARYLLDNAVGSRHPNGGGWVARGCTVAPTAYVGRDCMVLDGARVLDHAILEDYAIASGKDVVIKDHARLFGGAVVCGAAEVSGYARLSRNISNRKVNLSHREVNGVRRPEYTPCPDAPVKRTTPERRTYCYLGGYPGLEANYGMDREETVLLEDLFQERGHAFKELLSYDGVMTGRPGFVVDGERRAYTFNGRGQYAELGPMVADFGAITVAVALKLDGKGERTIFDFGSAADNCYKLTAGPGGALSLVTIVKGKKGVLSAPAIPNGKWTSVCVEIDGRAIAIFYDNKKVASRASSFRPADVFPGGRAKRNFIAASRDRKNGFRGAIDYVRIYSTTYADFENDGIVPEISSRRVDGSFFDRFWAFKDVNAKRLAEWRKSGKKMQVDASRLETWLAKKDELKKKYDRLGEEKAAELKKEYEAARKAFEAKRQRLYKQFDERPDVVRKRAGAKALEDRIRALRKEIDEGNTRLKAGRKAMDDARKAVETIRNEARASVQKQADAIEKQVRDLHQKHRKRVTAARAADARYQAARKAEEAMRKKMEALPKDAPPLKRKNVRRDLDDLRHKLRREEHRVDGAPSVMAPREKADALRRRIERIRKDAVEKNPRYARAEAESRVAQEAYRELERQRYNDPRLKALEKERAKYDTGRGREAFVRKEMGEKAQKDLKKKEVAVREYRERVRMLHNADEWYGLDAWASFNFMRAVNSYMKQFEPFSITENEQNLREAFKAQQGKWSSEVDWEDDKVDLEKLKPYEQRWHKRMKPWMFK